MNNECPWTEDRDGVWKTDCGELFLFNDGGPKENEFKFCLYCGKALNPKYFNQENQNNERG